jgi:hypothetical protein
MDTVLQYRGLQVTETDVSFIVDLIATHPQATRCALSQELCAAWGWVQPYGYPRDVVCRGLLLALHRADLITLPAPPWAATGRSGRPAAQLMLPFEATPVCGTLAELGPLVFQQVRRTAQGLAGIRARDGAPLRCGRPPGAHGDG